MYTINALSFRCILMILHLSRMRRNVNRNVYNAGKIKCYTGMMIIYWSKIKLRAVASRFSNGWSELVPCSGFYERGVVSQATYPAIFLNWKVGGDNSYAVPHAEKWGDTSPRPPPIDARARAYK